MTTEAIRRAKLQSNPPHQQTTQLVTGGMPFPSPNNNVKAVKGKVSHSTDLLTPSSSGGILTWTVTTKGSWILWEEGCQASHQPCAKPVVSLMTPVPS